MSNNTKHHNRSTASSVLFGILVASAGVLFLLNEFNLLHLNLKIVPIFMIIIGIINGYKKGFTRFSTLIFIILGIVWLIPKFTVYGVSSESLFWPIMLIIGGIFIALRAKQKDSYLNTQRENFAQRFEINNDPSTENKQTYSDEKFVNIEAYFGGRKEIITSKQFGGCSATAICGGAEINLMQADNIAQPMVIDLRVLFGGIEIIVPSHWEIINEVDVLFGGIEDKRNLRTASDLGETKKLLLRGSVTFGGLELKSY